MNREMILILKNQEVIMEALWYLLEEINSVSWECRSHIDEQLSDTGKFLRRYVFDPEVDFIDE